MFVNKFNITLNKITIFSFKIWIIYAMQKILDPPYMDI